MEYIKVKWIHNLDSEPILIYSEIDSNRWEIRKVEVYADGRMDFADKFGSKGDTRLGLEPVPTVSEIMEDPEFEVTEINKEEFEGVWDTAKK